MQMDILLGVEAAQVTDADDPDLDGSLVHDEKIPLFKNILIKRKLFSAGADLLFR